MNDRDRDDQSAQHISLRSRAVGIPRKKAGRLERGRVTAGERLGDDQPGDQQPDAAVEDGHDILGLPVMWVTSETAMRALDQLGVARGSTLLINGASGSVGSAAVQFAVARGARVIGTAGAANHDYLRSLGAEPVTYGEGLTGRVRALAPKGVSEQGNGRGKLVLLIG
jgi:hypothetical protein